MTPKIRWYTQKDEYGHLITAEISLGRCGRCIEHHIIPYWEHLAGQKSVFACTIERIQKNMEDVLNDSKN